MQLNIAFSVYRGNPLSGGQGVYTHYLTRELSRLGHLVTVFAGQPYPRLAEGIELVKLPSLDMYREPDPFRWPKLKELNDVTDIFEVGLRLFGGFPEPRTFSTRLKKELKYHRKKFDILHDNQSLGSAIREIARTKMPVVASIHHPITVDRRIDLAQAETLKDRISKYRWYGFSKMQERVAKDLLKIMTVSEKSKEDIVAHMGINPGNIAVIPVGVDTGIFYPDQRLPKNNTQIIAVVSSDVYLKGMLFLLEAMNIVAKSNPSVTLLVVGKLTPDGPAHQVLKKSHFKSRIKFMHDVPEADLAHFYRESTLAVVPSLYEGFSLPAIQALASGLPVVATSGGALPEVLGRDGKCAVLVEPGNVNDLAQAIVKLLETKEMRDKLASEGLKRVRENFTWEMSARKVVEQYEYAIAKFNYIKREY